MHIVVKRLSEPKTKLFVFNTGLVPELDIVNRKRNIDCDRLHPEALRLQPHGRMGCHRKLVPEAGLQ